MRSSYWPVSLVIGASFVVALNANAIRPGAFKKHVIDAEFAGGYQVSVADIDKDGMPDVVALSTTPSQLVWYRNPGWERHVITTKTEDNIDVAPYDIDGDGDQDLALAYAFALQSPDRGELAWLECPPNPAAAQEWTVHHIAAVPASHRVRWSGWSDAQGSKHVHLLDLPIIGPGAKSPAYEGGASLLAFALPAKPAETPWAASAVAPGLEMAHGICVAQWDDDAPNEILTASFSGVQLFDPNANGTGYERRDLYKGHAGKRPAQGSSEVALGVVASQEMKFIATIEPWHGNEVVVYEIGTPVTMPAERTVIDTSLKDGHALICMDIEKDGNDEIIAGCRGGEKAIYIYQFAAENGEWERTLIDEGNIGAAGLFAADINQDGYTDIVAIGTATHNVVWYENVWESSIEHAAP